MPDAAPRFQDAAFLRDDQYRSDANLAARIALHRRFGTNPVPWAAWLFDHLDLPEDACVLELGCGRGDLWVDNRDRLPPRWRPTLSDLSSGMVDVARRRLDGAGIEATFSRADARSLPFATGAFDAVVANHVLYHVPERRRALAEVRRVLQPGGRFYAATNGREHLRELAHLTRLVAPETPIVNVADDFGLENGAAQLRPFFDEVVRHDYPDALMVTEVEPVVAYLRSSWDVPVIDQAGWAAIRRHVADAVATEGAFRVTKSAGLFVAS
jgi:SAM-dependent methyltransferase